MDREGNISSATALNLVLDTLFAVSQKKFGGLAAIQFYFYLSLAGASSFSPLIYGSVLLLFGQSASDGFIALFTLSGIFYLVGALVLYWAHRTK